MQLVGKYLEIFFVLLVVYLVLTHYLGFSSALNSVGNLNTSAIKAFQGR